MVPSYTLFIYLVFFKINCNYTNYNTKRTAKRKRAPGKENMKQASSETGGKTEAEERRSSVLKEQCEIGLLETKKQAV